MECYFVLKLLDVNLQNGNRPDVIQKRHDYANWFMGQAIVSHTVFVDECGYNIWTARSQGRAIRGKTAYRQVWVGKEEEI